MADLGVYIHIPFCASRCDYCAFATWTDRGHLIDEYLGAVRADIVATMARDAATATTVFVGGVLTGLGRTRRARRRPVGPGRRRPS